MAGYIYREKGRKHLPEVILKPLVHPVIKPLTKKERRVIELLSQGLTNEEIAARLFLSSNTIKTHLMRIGYKMQLERTTRIVIVVEAIRRGIINLDLIEQDPTMKG